jgi:hypothetical protein
MREARCVPSADAAERRLGVLDDRHELTIRIATERLNARTLKRTRRSRD